jgi:hypothetical protein
MEKSRYERAMGLSEQQFKLLVGIKKKLFAEMTVELQKAYDEKHKNRGRHSDLSVELMLMMALTYWRQYVTFFELGFEYGIAQSTAHDIVVWVEDTLVKCGKFSLPGKKALLEDRTLEVVLLDVMESAIERPKKNKKITTPGKRKNTP